LLSPIPVRDTTRTVRLLCLPFVQAQYRTAVLPCRPQVLYHGRSILTTVTMADRSFDFAELEAEKMSEHSDSSSSISIPPRISGAEPTDDLEKSTSHATQHSAVSGHPVQKTVTAQDWTGPDDPENPMNWPIWKKVYHVAIPALQCFTM